MNGCTWTGLVGLVVVPCALGCGSPEGDAGAGGGGGGAGLDAGDDGDGGALLPTTSGRVDLLFLIDNSASMADKQVLLAEVSQDLVQRLTNPRCVDPAGAPAAVQPSSPAGSCPAGTAREHPPVRDLHVGVISSSLGGHGADVCSPASASFNQMQAEMAHLLDRAPGGGEVPTYQGLRFLAWDPEQEKSPPGMNDAVALGSAVRDLIVGVDQRGCGYEAQLESVYRFLVDPEPYASISLDESGVAVPEGIDAVLLKQRADFLRPDSLVLVTMLTDENDCSVIDGGKNWIVNQLVSGAVPFVMPRGTSVCEQDPADPCCRSCALDDDPPGCVPRKDDAGCQSPHTTLTDAINLRCWQQKRRFGRDFLWPIERYVRGLSSPEVPDRSGALVPNPLFADPETGAPRRAPELVFLAGIVGVPWQDLARDPLDLAKGYLDAKELVAAKRWEVILGDPAKYVPPQDPLMLESIAPRVGTNPVTGAGLAPPDSPPMANPMNGHEWNIAYQDDLQYACIFELPTPRDCSVEVSYCDCKSQPPGSNNPLCQDESGAYDKFQRRAKAFPGLRHLDVLRGLGEQAIVASVCPANTLDPASPVYAYRPAIGAMIEAIRGRLE